MFKIQIQKINRFKTVEYYGSKFIVPFETVAIATDSQGYIFAYRSKSEYHEHIKGWTGRFPVCIGRGVLLDGSNAKDSLVEYGIEYNAETN